MKVVFAGPSLHGSTIAVPSGIIRLEPARQGDVYRAVTNGANVVGLIDGYFETSAAVWHKELLFALSQGVTVFGASSMGALRASECHNFGMIGVGRVFEDYRRGRWVDDAAVALAHAPGELDYLPLSLALVDVFSTLEHLEDMQGISPLEGTAILNAAETIFFKDRTWRAIVSACEPDPTRSKRLLHILTDGFVSQKRNDAELLLRQMADADDRRGAKPSSWTLHSTTYFAPSAAAHQ